MRKPQVEESSGAALVGRLRAEMAGDGLEPDGKEVELLAIAEALQDRIVDLESVITAEGMTTVSKSGVVHLNPAVGEARQTRAALARVLSGIQMEQSVKNPVKSAAAQSRWRQHNLAKAAPREGTGACWPGRSSQRVVCAAMVTGYGRVPGDVGAAVQGAFGGTV